MRETHFTTFLETIFPRQGAPVPSTGATGQAKAQSFYSFLFFLGVSAALRETFFSTPLEIISFSSIS